MLSVKIVFLLFAVAMAADTSENRDYIQLASGDATELLSCDAHGKLITGQKTCIMKCTIGCTSVGCGLFKKCEKMTFAADAVEPYASQYKCHCNFGMSAFAYAARNE
ncbi:hypothetical protein HA402_003906 [Bradysia odoriphaga]|nr:hypothetical protein HA402_003906 [Bradysia odoriphaga]